MFILLHLWMQCRIPALHFGEGNQHQTKLMMLLSFVLFDDHGGTYSCGFVGLMHYFMGDRWDSTCTEQLIKSFPHLFVLVTAG